MIRKGYISFIMIMAMFVISVSCSEFLDEVPDNRVSLDDLEKASQLLTNGYSVASPAFTDWMTDDVSWTIGTNIRASHEQLYNWEDVNTGPTEQDTPDYYWYQTYNSIAHANEVLAVLDDLPADSEEDIRRKRAIRSEALLIRAYGHFMLVNLFAPHYTVDNSAPGIPYITEPETTFLAQYERKSVRRVYDDIEDDLLDGLELLDDSFFDNSGKYHFNRGAALAFASRFYLFKGDYVRCVQYSDELLGSNPGAFVRDLTSVQFDEASSSIQGYPQLYSSPELASNLLLMRKISLIQRLDFAFGPEQNAYSELFDLTPLSGVVDERENPAFVKGDNALFPVRYESLFERSSLNSNVGLPYHIAISFRGEEVLLNRAEANIYLGQLDEVIADLQVLTDRRYSGNGDKTLSMELLKNWIGPDLSDELVLLNYVLIVERRKEFLMQGLRWFDLKRYGFSVTHLLQDGSEVTLDGDDPRKALQIPSSAITVGGLEPNPR